MARMFNDEESSGGSLFPTNAAAGSMREFASAMQNIGPMIHQYRQNKAMKQPLSEFLGAKSPEELPEGLRALYNTPVGKIAQLQQALGGSLSQLMTRQSQPSYALDPRTGQLVPMAGGGGTSPIGGAPQGGMPPMPMGGMPMSNKMPIPGRMDMALGPQGPRPFPGAGAPPQMMGQPQQGQSGQQGLIPLAGVKARDVINSYKQPKAAAGLTPEQLNATVEMAMKSSNPGAVVASLPGFGQNSLKSQVVAELAHRGVDIGAWAMDYNATKDYLKTVNGPAFQSTIKYLGSVRPNFKTVIGLSDDISRTFVKPINRAQLAIMKSSGNVKAVQYATAVTEVSDQVAKILQGGGTGSATSDAKLKQAMELIDQGFTPAQMKGVMVTLGGMLAERENALKTLTVQTLGNQKRPKVDPAVRFQQLIGQGKSEADAYKILAQEGH